MNKQTGFTLIELMIAISLGLLIVAAALFMLFSGQKNVALQKSAASLQDDQNFGLSYIAKNIRQANLHTASASMSSTTRYGGVVFGSANLDSFLTIPNNFSSTYATLQVPASNAVKSNMQMKSGASYADALNDQLVIQYRPAETGGYDCEGKLINSTDIYVVERYFVRTDANGVGTAAERSALACASSHYSANLSAAAELSSSTSGIYANGQIIMKRVDLFNVRFLTQSGANQRYMTVKQYNDATGTKPRILAIQLAVIARAADPSIDSAVSTTQEFQVFGQTFRQKSSFPSRYIRTPIVQTIALRNALGARS